MKGLPRITVPSLVFFVIATSPAFADQPLVTNQTKLEKPGNHGGFHAFAVSLDGKLVAGGTGAISTIINGRKSGGGGDVVLWNALSGKLLKTLGEHGATVRNLVFSEDGKTLASFSRQNGLIKVWDIPSGKLRHTMKIAPEEKKTDLRWPQLALSADGNTLLTVSSRSIPIDEDSRVTIGGELTVWDLKTGKKRWSKPESNVYAAVLTPDGRGMVSIHQTSTDVHKDENGRTRFRTKTSLQSSYAGTGKVLDTAELEQAGSPDSIYLFDGNTVLLLTRTGLSRRERKTGEEIERFEWHKDRRAGDAALSADGKWVGRSWPGWLEVVDASTGETVGVTTTEFPKHYWNVSFSPDMKFAVAQQAGGLDSGPVVLELATQ